MGNSNSIENDKIQLLAYSERGAINSIMFSILYHENKNSQLEKFLNCFDIKISDDTQIENIKIKAATIFIEQSFSDFGDADLVICCEGEQSYLFFIEAKVSAHQSIKKHKKYYEEKKEELGAQLKLKAYLSHYLLVPNDLKGKVTEPSLLKRQKHPRWLGENAVVHEAARKIAIFINMYKPIIVYSAIFPCENSSNKLKSEVLDHIRSKTKVASEITGKSHNYNVAHAIASWADIYNSFMNISNVIDVFDHNDAQIYEK